MKEELLAASALLVQFCNRLRLSQPKSAVHQEDVKLFQQHWRHLKGNYDLNSAFENADRLIEQKFTGSHLY